MRTYQTTHLVKGEDLNHHGTLFAARAAAWLVEAAFAATACEVGTAEGIVCRALHEMSFEMPVKKGSVLCIDSRVVGVGKTSIKVMAKAYNAIDKKQAVESFFTFVTLEECGTKRIHGMVLDEAVDEMETADRRRAEWRIL